jgi:hypothetical protein
MSNAKGLRGFLITLILSHHVMHKDVHSTADKSRSFNVFILLQNSIIKLPIFHPVKEFSEAKIISA